MSATTKATVSAPAARKAPAAAPAARKAPAAAPVTNFAVDVKTWNSDQCFAALEEGIVKNSVIADRLRVIHGDNRSCMRAYGDYLRKTWPDFTVGGPDTHKGERLAEPQRRYMAIAYYFRSDRVGQAGHARDIGTVISMFLSSAKKKAPDNWLSEFVSALNPEDKALLKKLVK